MSRTDTHPYPRKDVYELIDGERDYQDKRWSIDTTTTGGYHTPTEWLVFIQSYLSEAMDFVSRNADPEASKLAMANVRKIAGMCVAAMEQHFAPPRLDK